MNISTPPALVFELCSCIELKRPFGLVKRRTFLLISHTVFSVGCRFSSFFARLRSRYAFSLLRDLLKTFCFPLIIFNYKQASNVRRETL